MTRRFIHKVRGFVATLLVVGTSILPAVGPTGGCEAQFTSLGNTDMGSALGTSSSGWDAGTTWYSGGFDPNYNYYTDDPHWAGTPYSYDYYNE